HTNGDAHPHAQQIAHRVAAHAARSRSRTSSLDLPWLHRCLRSIDKGPHTGKTAGRTAPTGPRMVRRPLHTVTDHRFSFSCPAPFGRRRADGRGPSAG